MIVPLLSDFDLVIFWLAAPRYHTIVLTCVIEIGYAKSLQTSERAAPETPGFLH